jgi:hypothetical protein
MKTSTARAIGRLLWVLAGFFVSLPAFGPPLAGFIALWAVVSMSSGSFLPGVAAHRSDPAVHGLIVAASIYCVYWLSVAWMVVQFLLRRELSAIPLFLVSVIAVSAVVALQPWQAPHEAFALGPWSLLHVAYMATIIGASARRVSSPRAEDGLSGSGR